MEGAKLGAQNRVPAGPGPEPLFRAPVKLERAYGRIWPYALPVPAQKGSK